MQSQAIMDGDLTILIQYPFMYREVRVNYLASNLPASSYETRRKAPGFSRGDRRRLGRQP